MTGKNHAIPPPKLIGLMQKVPRLIEDNRYVATGHARRRLDQREVSMLEVQAVIASGKRATKRDEFHTYDKAGERDQPLVLCIFQAEL